MATTKKMFENIRAHIEGRATTFSQREKTPVLYQLNELEQQVERLAKVVEAAVDFYPYAHNIAQGLEGYQPTYYHAAKVMTNSVEKLAALVEAAKEYDDTQT